MNPNVFFEAPLATQIHIVAALAAAVLGSVVLWRRKGGFTRRMAASGSR